MRSLLVALASLGCVTPPPAAHSEPPTKPPPRAEPCATPVALQVDRTIALPSDVTFDRFSLDGSRVRAVADDRLVVLDAKNGAALSTIALRPDATAASFDGRVQILQTGVDFFRLDGAKKSPLVTTPPVMGGTRILTDEGDLFVQGCEGVFDARTGALVCPMEGCFAGGSEPEGRILHDRFLTIVNSRGGFGFDVRACRGAAPHEFTVTPVFDITPDGTLSLTTPHAFFPYPPDDTFALRDPRTDEIRVKLRLQAGSGDFAAALCSTGALAVVLIDHELRFFGGDGAEVLAAPWSSDADAIEFAAGGDALAVVSKARRAITFVRLVR